MKEWVRDVLVLTAAIGLGIYFAKLLEFLTVLVIKVLVY